MLNNPTIDKLKSLKLTGMAMAFEEQLKTPGQDLDFESRLAILVEQEWITRENRKLKRRLTQAKLHQPACIEDIIYSPDRGISRTKIMELAHLQWLQHKMNLLITGATGCGKTYLACALAHKACLNGFTSRYYRLTRLWEVFKIAKASGTYAQLLSQIAKIDVLILDDWGLIRPEKERIQDLLEMLDDRYKNRSTIITSQIPISCWHEYLEDPTLADAILDRLVHNAEKITLTGPTMRDEANRKSSLQNEPSIE